MQAAPPTCDVTDTEISVDSFMRALARLPTAPAERRQLAEALYQSHVDHFAEATRGRYALEALLGTGGMGVVYAATNTRTQRPVAIKFLHPRPFEPAHVQRERALRFQREASAAGRIRHPNVVAIYDVEPDVPTPYLVMERLEGESLRQRMNRAPLSTIEAVSILTEAMRGVVEAHEHGVIHRDLKPDNIFLAEARGGQALLVKVLDFGVSRLLTTDGAARPSTLTGIGHRLGTPAYMPIEQLRGDADCDARVDVYALGVTLYEAISGQRPAAQVDRYIAGEHRAALPGSADPLPLSALRSDVDHELSAIVTQAIRQDRSGRFSDVRSFALALEGWLSRARLAALPRNPAPPSTRALRRKGWLIWLLGIAVASLVLVMWFARKQVFPRRELGEPRWVPSGSTVSGAAEPVELAPSQPAQLAPSQPAHARRVERQRRVRATSTSSSAPHEAQDPSPRTDPKRATELLRHEF